MASSIATNILVCAVALLSFLQGAAAFAGIELPGYGEYGYGLIFGYGEYGMTTGGARRLQQSKGGYGEYGYGMASYGEYGYGMVASVSGTYGMVSGRKLLQDDHDSGYGEYSYGYGEASYGYGMASYGYGEATYGYY